MLDVRLQNGKFVQLGDNIIGRVMVGVSLLRGSMLWALLSCVALLSASVLAVGEESEDGEATAVYVPLSPPFVINYGGAGRLKYIKTEISVRAGDAETAGAIQHNMPLIRNAIVMLISRQTEEDINSQIGIENLRAAAKSEITALLEAEQSAHEVIEVFFNSFVVQK